MDRPQPKFKMHDKVCAKKSYKNNPNADKCLSFLIDSISWDETSREYGYNYSWNEEDLVLVKPKLLLYEYMYRIGTTWIISHYLKDKKFIDNKVGKPYQEVRYLRSFEVGDE